MTKNEVPVYKDGPKPGEVYRHYKGNLYVIWCQSLFESDFCRLVTYHDFGCKHFWTRTLTDFLELVDGKPRFTLVGKLYDENESARTE